MNRALGIFILVLLSASVQARGDKSEAYFGFSYGVGLYSDAADFSFEPKAYGIKGGMTLKKYFIAEARIGGSGVASNQGAPGQTESVAIGSYTSLLGGAYKKVAREVTLYGLVGYSHLVADIPLKGDVQRGGTSYALGTAIASSKYSTFDIEYINYVSTPLFAYGAFSVGITKKF